jgi:transposase
VLSIQNQYCRNTGVKLKADLIKRSDEYLVEVEEENIRLAMESNHRVIRALDEQIKQIECRVRKQVKLKPEYELLLTVDGIGDILGLTIMLETGDIGRFKEVGNYASYCRCVDSQYRSNDKKKGEAMRRMGISTWHGHS